MKQTALIQDICNCKKQTPENEKDCSARSAGHSIGCSRHHPLSEHSTGIRLRHVALAARLILGGVFIYASLDKILHPAAFAEAVFNYQLLPSQLINLTALILPWLELILGVLLLSGIWVSGAVLGVNLLMVTFLAAIIFNTARGLNISCGCFSTETTASGLSGWTVLRDVFFFSLSGYLLFVTTHVNRLKKQSEGV